MKIIHNIEDGNTFVVHDFDASKVYSSLAQLATHLQSNSLTLNIGLTKLHPKDRYNRKIGVATAKAKTPITAVFSLTRVTQNEKDLTIDYFNDNFNLSLKVKVYKDSGAARIIFLRDETRKRGRSWIW